MKLNYAKYSGIIISVTIFLFIEISILATNYILSFDIAKDSIAVNVAGRQRMLSQRMTKSLLDARLTSDTAEKAKSIKELEGASNLFNQSLEGFDIGTPVLSPDKKTITLDPVHTTEDLNTIENAKKLWLPYKDFIQKVTVETKDNAFTNQQALNEAIEYGRNNNLSLLGLMNDLTVSLEKQGKSRAAFLRNIQTIGIILGTLNFLVIMFYFLRQLQRSDDQTLEAQKETAQILETVDEGLFLVDHDLTIGDQTSKKMNDIFSNNNIHGEPLLSFLGEYISSKDKETTKEYFDLLFDKRKSARLIGDLNPLREVSLQVPDKHMGHKKKFLKFSFSRVGENKEIDKILTTVTDISNEVKLREELKRSEKENAEQMNILTTVLNSNQDTLASFIKQSEKAFREINDILKAESNENSTELKGKIQHLIIIMHSIKGDASALSIGNISELAHLFESDAQELLNKNYLEGKDFVPLIVLLEKMISYNETIASLYSRVFNSNAKNAEPGNNETFPKADIRTEWKNLFQLSSQVADRVDKSIEFTASGLNDYPLQNEFKEYINTVSIQLIRNSINHGIETKTERFETEKPAIGRINLNLSKLNDDSFELTFKDDGAGIHKNKLLEKAVSAGIITEKQAEAMSPKKILGLLFHPGLSTADSVTTDSGRGVGMSLVLDKTNEINGRINIQTSNGIGTTFKITIPSNAFKAKDTDTSFASIDIEPEALV